MRMGHAVTSPGRRLVVSTLAIGAVFLTLLLSQYPAEATFAIHRAADGGRPLAAPAARIVRP